MKKLLSFLTAVCLLLSFTCFVGQAEEDNTLHIQMTVEQKDEGIQVHLVDDRGGSVSTWPVMLVLDDVQVDTILTDSEGYALFTYTIPEETREISCTAKDGQYDIYRFVGCTVSLEREDETTQTEESQTTVQTADSESTTQTTTTQTTIVTTSTSQTSAFDETTFTTVVDGNRVAIGIVPDDALLSVSQSSVPEYRTKARMWMDKDLYDSLVSVSTATLQLQMKFNEQASNLSAFIAAKNADPLFADYADELVKGYALDMSIAYVDESSNIPLEIEDGMYTIEIPVPTVLNTCTKFAVSVCKSDGLSQLIEVKPVNGVLNFTMQRFQSLAIIGFGDNLVSIQSLSQTPWLIVVVIVCGVVLVVLGVLLLVFVTFRRRKVENVNSDDAEELLLFGEEESVEVSVSPLKEESVTVETESEDKADLEETVEVLPEIASESEIKPEETTHETEDNTAVVQNHEDTSENTIDDMLDEVLNDLENMES